MTTAWQLKFTKICCFSFFFQLCITIQEGSHILKNKDIFSYLTGHFLATMTRSSVSIVKTPTCSFPYLFYVCISKDYHETPYYESLKCFKFLHELDLFCDQTFDLDLLSVFNDHIWAVINEVRSKEQWINNISKI